MLLLFERSHKLISIKDPEAKISPKGENTTQFTSEECPVIVFIFYPVKTFQTPRVLSTDPEAKNSPLGENVTLFTQEE